MKLAWMGAMKLGRIPLKSKHRHRVGLEKPQGLPIVIRTARDVAYGFIIYKNPSERSPGATWIPLKG